MEEAPSEDGDENDDMEEDDDNQTVMDEDDPEELVRSPEENGGEELLAMYRRSQVPPSSFQQSSQYRQQAVLPEPVPIPPFIPQETMQQANSDTVYSPNPIERLPPGNEELPDMIPPISPRAQPLPVNIPPMKPKGKIPKNPEEKTEFVAACTTRPKIPRTPQSTTPVPYDEPYSRGNTLHDLNGKLFPFGK